MRMAASKLIETNCFYCGFRLSKRDGAKYNGEFIKFKRFYCSTYCKGRHQVQLREMSIATNEWLYDQYWIQRRSAYDIGRQIGRDGKRVLEWIKLANIPTRKRGSESSNCFKKGETSKFKGMKHTEETKKKLSEIAIKDGRVPGYDHKVNALKGKKGLEVHSWKGGKTPERQKVYSSEEWKNAVINVWHRDDAICQCCFKDHRKIDRSKEKFHIHHIISFQVERYRCDVDNLVLLCEDCHRWVHGKENKYNLFIEEHND